MKGEEALASVSVEYPCTKRWQATQFVKVHDDTLSAFHALNEVAVLGAECRRRPVSAIHMEPNIIRFGPLGHALEGVKGPRACGARAPDKGQNGFALGLDVAAFFLKVVKVHAVVGVGADKNERRRTPAQNAVRPVNSIIGLLRH